MAKELKDKVALVTGGGSGIGEAVVKHFCREGASVLITDLDEEGGRLVLEEVKNSGGNARFLKADVSDPADCERSVVEAMAAFGALHVAVNNAGIAGPAELTGDYPLDGWRKVIDVNLNGVFFGMRYQIPAMLKAGGGSIINIASILGQVGFATASAYVTAKHGVVGLSRNAGIEYAQQGIRVNAVGPAFIRTPLLTNNLNEEQLEGIGAMHPIGRLGTPDEVAELVVWLAGDRSSFVTASYYAVDGGYLAK